jgi:hypothetical protein
VSVERRRPLDPSGADRGDGRAIGPVGTAVRVFAGVLALAVAGLWQGLGWWDVAAAAIAFPLVGLSAWWLLSARGPHPWPASAIAGDGLGYAESLLAVAIAAALTFVTPADQPAVWAWLGGSLLLAAARGDGGCEALALANALGGRRDHGGCVLFTPLDAAEGRRRRSAVQRRAARPPDPLSPGP